MERHWTGNQNFYRTLAACVVRPPSFLPQRGSVLYNTFAIKSLNEAKWTHAGGQAY